jgi:Helix-turn-helix domain
MTEPTTNLDDIGKKVRLIYQYTTHATNLVGLGDMLRQQRKQTGESLRAVAKVIGVSAPYLSDVERGLRTISDTNLGAIIFHLARLQHKNKPKL